MLLSHLLQPVLAEVVQSIMFASVIFGRQIPEAPSTHLLNIVIDSAAVGLINDGNNERVYNLVANPQTNVVPALDNLPEEAELADLALGSVVEAQPALQEISASSSSATSNMASGPITRSRARVCKPHVPLVVTQVRRSTRNNNDDYMHTALPAHAPRSRRSTITKAKPPAVMQITEMQRIGVE